MTAGVGVTTSAGGGAASGSGISTDSGVSSNTIGLLKARPMWVSQHTFVIHARHGAFGVTRLST